jgi:AAA+ ATPase superfamily predicted ATPase
MSFIENYVPTTIDKIIGNKHRINSINNLLKENFNSIMCVLGPQNIGKTNSIKIILKHHKYRIKYLDITKNKKNVFEVLSNYLFNKSVDSYFSKPLKTAYFIDNLEHVENQNELSKIVEILEKKKLKQDDIIVCISNNQSQLEHLKKFTCFMFETNSENDIIRLINRVKLKENLKIGKYEVQIIAKNCNNSFNNTFNTIKQLQIMYGNTITNSNLKNFYNKSKNKFSGKKIRQEILMEIFSKETTAYQCIVKFNKDKSMLPMLINDNYLVFFENSNVPNAVKISLLKQCTHYIMLGDICDKLIYNQNNWANQYIHCLLSCYFPTRVVCKLGNFESSILDNSKSKTLGKYSRYRTNIKNLYLLFDRLNGKQFYSIEDVYYMACSILYHLYDPMGTIEIGIKMMQYYNLDDTFIEKLHKTDVLNKERYKIKNKNKIKKLFKDT